MKARRTYLILSLMLAGAVSVSAQSYYNDDIYYDASKDKALAAQKAAEQAQKAAEQAAAREAALVGVYQPADTYSADLVAMRDISVDDYNRRGIFAVADTLSVDSTANDFAYTRRIEQFYNPEIVTSSTDEEVAQLYYSEPQVVNVYVNTPCDYWGYDYFYPGIYGWYSPYWGASWRWGAGWYWNAWYDPYWAWGPGWGWGWGWSWRPAWGGGNHFAHHRPGGFGTRPGGGHGSIAGARPNGGRHSAQAAGARRPAGTSSTNIPTTISGRHASTRTQSGTSTSGRGNGYNSSSRPSSSGNNSTYRSSGSNSSSRHSSSPSYNSGSSSRNYNSGSSRGGGFSGGGRSGGGHSGGGRGRH